MNLRKVRLELPVSLSSLSYAIQTRFRGSDCSHRTKSNEIYCILNHAPAEFKNKKEVLFVCIQQFSSALEFASVELKDDRDVVLVTVKQDSTMLRYEMIRH